MFHFALLAALLAAEVPAEPEPVLVGIDVEAGRVELGCFALWTAPPTGEPLMGTSEYPEPPGHRDAGVLLDAGDVPFRTWVAVDFEGRALSLLDGEFGVGFTPRLWVHPSRIDGDVVGNGTVAFAGTLTVALRGTRAEETLPVAWSRGFASSSEPGEHRVAWTRAVPVATSGTTGPYRWSVAGVLDVDLHVYAAKPPK